MKFIINTDGASRGNPGLAASAFVIKSTDGVTWVQEGVFLDQATNNEAEYQAVWLSLSRLKSDFAKYFPTEVIVVADSLLIIKQLSNQFKVKDTKLRQWYQKIKDLEKLIGKVSYSYTPRSQNFLADKLANLTLDKHATT